MCMLKPKSRAIRCSGLISYVARLHSEETVKWWSFLPCPSWHLSVACVEDWVSLPWLSCTLAPQEDSHEACVSWPPPPLGTNRSSLWAPLTVFPSTLFVSGNQARPFVEQVRGRTSASPLQVRLLWVGYKPPSSQTSLVGWSSDCSQRSSACNVPSVGFLLCLLMFPGITPTPSPKLPALTSLCYEDVHVLDIKKPFGLSNCLFLLISKWYL